MSYHFRFFVLGTWVRCKIRLRDIVRSVSCISGEAAIHKKIDMIFFFCFVDFDMVSLPKLWVLVRDALFSLCFHHFGLFLGRLYWGFCCFPSVKHLRDTYLGIPWISYYRCRFFFHENILCNKFKLFFGLFVMEYNF